MKQLRHLLVHLRVVGLEGIAVLRLRPLLLKLQQRFGQSAESDLYFQLRGMSRALRFRLGSSDLRVASQVFVHQEYACLCGLQDVETILDCGANVGYTSAYLLDRYPQARLIAVEPDSRNVELCRKNLEPYGSRAVVLHGAVWPRSAKLKLSVGNFRDGEAWATQVRECGPTESPDVQAWGIADLMDNFGIRRIDVLKMDIEGSEGLVFSEDSERWLRCTRRIAVEIHDRENERLVTDALEPFDFRRSASGELAVFQQAPSQSPAWRGEMLTA